MFNMGNYYDYDRIKSIVLPATITKIGSGAFSGLSNVRSITIKGALTEIGDDAFAGCTNLTSITLPSSLKKLGAWAFEACKSLKTITIPSGVTALPNYVFSDCTSLATINIPSALKNFGINAFSGTAWLKAGVYAAKTQSALILADQSLVMETKKYLMNKCPMLITAIGGAGAVPNDILDKMVAVVKSGW